METNQRYFIKDLRIITNRLLKDMVIVDNLVESFAFQIENGIPILEWRGDKYDMELKYLSRYLNELSECEDIPAFNRERLKLVRLAGLSPENIGQ